MESRVNILELYHSGWTIDEHALFPVTFLSALSTSYPIEFQNNQTHHNFNLQLTGIIETDWFRGSRVSTHIVAPGHTSLNVASESFQCRVGPVSESLSLHVMLPLKWMSIVRLQHEDQLTLRRTDELRPSLGQWQPRVSHSARKIAEALQVPGTQLRLHMDELLLNLSIRLLQADRSLNPRNSSGTLPAKALTRVIEYLHSHYTEDITLRSLATESDLSPFHLCRSFRSSMGVSPWQYLKDLRLSKSRLDLLTSDSSITTIALQLGFNSSSHFSTAFRQSYGISPRDFRKTNQLNSRL